MKRRKDASETFIEYFCQEMTDRRTSTLLAKKKEEISARWLKEQEEMAAERVIKPLESPEESKTLEVSVSTSPTSTCTARPRYESMDIDLMSPSRTELKTLVKEYSILIDSLLILVLAFTLN